MANIGGMKNLKDWLKVHKGALADKDDSSKRTSYDGCTWLW